MHSNMHKSVLYLRPYGMGLHSDFHIDFQRAIDTGIAYYMQNRYTVPSQLCKILLPHLQLRLETLESEQTPVVWLKITPYRYTLTDIFLGLRRIPDENLVKVIQTNLNAS